MLYNERHFISVVHVVMSSQSMSSIENIVPMLQQTSTSITLSANDESQWGIEGMRSQEFSVGIFIFLMVCIVVFSVIVVKFMNSGRGVTIDGEGKKLKTGEKIMFVWIFFGIIAAVIMGAMQLLQGYLF